MLRCFKIYDKTSWQTKTRRVSSDNTENKTAVLVLELKKREKPKSEVQNPLKSNIRGIASVSEEVSRKPQ